MLKHTFCVERISVTLHHFTAVLNVDTGISFTEFSAVNMIFLVINDFIFHFIYDIVYARRIRLVYKLSVVVDAQKSGSSRFGTLYVVKQTCLTPDAYYPFDRSKEGFSRISVNFGNLPFSLLLKVYLQMFHF